MKKYILRVIALLILASATLPSCSVQYRESHRQHRDDDHRDHDDHHDDHNNNG